MKTTIDKCVECGKLFEHHAAWEQDTCKKCRRRISNKKASPKYYAKNKEAILRKYHANRDNRMAYVKPQKGVIVYQPGQFEPDHYSKTAFNNWLSKKQFPPETIYILDGVEYRV